MGREEKYCTTEATVIIELSTSGGKSRSGNLEGRIFRLVLGAPYQFGFKDGTRDDEVNEVMRTKPN
jgi:hypothetical protein